MSDQLPSREETMIAVGRFVDQEPEIPFNLHDDLRVILAAAYRYAEGRLVDSEDIDRERLTFILWRNFYWDVAPEDGMTPEMGWEREKAEQMVLLQHDVDAVVAALEGTDDDGKETK